MTAPAARTYQTSENQILAYVLDVLVTVGQATGWTSPGMRQGVGRIVRDRTGEALHWQQLRAVQEIERITPTPRSVGRARSGRMRQRYAAALDAYDLSVLLLERISRAAIREVVEGAGLLAASDSVLLELLSTFTVIDSLAASGWKLGPLHLVRGRLCLRGDTSDGRRIGLWYQCTPQVLTQRSLYVPTLEQHGFKDNRPLRPDLTLRWTTRSGSVRTLLIECKLSEKGIAVAARRALIDLYAYGHNFRSSLKVADAPFGLGIIWGEGLKSSVNADVALCTPDQLPEVINRLVSS